MRLVEGDDRDVEVTWYWAPEGAELGPYTVLASGNWESDRVWPWLGPGEVKGAPRPWYDGANPWGFTGHGRHGTDQQYAHGLDHWPTAAEWVWHCKPWVSEVCLCVLTPKRVPVVGYSYTHEDMPPAIADVCLCVLPGAHTDIAPTVAASGVLSFPAVANVCFCMGPGASVGPIDIAPSRTVSVPEFADVCFCVSPGARFELPPPGPSRVSSAYGSGAGPAPPTTVSVVCFCVSPGARFEVPPPGPSRVSSGSRGSAGGLLFPAVADVCFCVSPGARFELPPPGPSRVSSAYGSGSAFVEEAEPADVCLCFEITATIIDHPPVPSRVSSGSYGTPGLLMAFADVCFCVDPGAIVEFDANPKPSGYGSYPSAGPLQTCCPSAPAVLVGKLTNKTGFAVGLPDSFSMVFGAGLPLVPGWFFGAGNYCGLGEANLSITCDIEGIGPLGLRLHSGATMIGPPSQAPEAGASCSPLKLVYIVSLHAACGAGGYTLTVTAT
jgi:hypothetical protein